MFLVAVFMTIDALIIRVLAGEIHPFFIVFTRAAFGLLVCLPWLLRKPQILETSGLGLHITRAIIKLLGLVTLFYALANSSLATVTTITFATPFFVVLGAWIFFFGETLHKPFLRTDNRFCWSIYSIATK